MEIPTAEKHASTQTGGPKKGGPAGEGPTEIDLGDVFDEVGIPTLAIRRSPNNQ